MWSVGLKLEPSKIDSRPSPAEREGEGAGEGLGNRLVHLHVLGLQRVELGKRLGHRLEPPSEVE